MKWEGHVARMEDMRMHTEFLSETYREETAQKTYA